MLLLSTRGGVGKVGGSKERREFACGEMERSHERAFTSRGAAHNDDDDNDDEYLGK